MLNVKRQKAEAGSAPTKSSPSGLRFYGEEFVFDTVSGLFYRVSASTSFILRSLQSGMKPEQLADEVRGRYGISHAAAARDIELLRNELVGNAVFNQVRL